MTKGTLTDEEREARERARSQRRSEEHRARMASDPEYAAAYRERHARNAKRSREKNPERVKEQQRRSEAKRRQRRRDEKADLLKAKRKEEKKEERRKRNNAASKLRYHRMMEAAKTDPAIAEKFRARYIAKSDSRRASDKARYDAMMALPYDSPERVAYRAKRRKQSNNYRPRVRERIREICRTSRARMKALDLEAYNARNRANNRRWHIANREKAREQDRLQRQRDKARREAQTFSKVQTPRFNAAVIGQRAFMMAEKAVPRRMDEDARADIIADIVLACMEARITVEEIPAKWKGFSTAHWKGRDLFGTLSLDAPMGEDGATLLDFLAAPAMEDHDYA